MSLKLVLSSSGLVNPLDVSGLESVYFSNSSSKSRGLTKPKDICRAPAKKIKKVTFGSGGLRAKIKNKKARNAFAKRHNCKNKKDRTKASYWSCNLPRYASQLGLGANMNTFW